MGKVLWIFFLISIVIFFVFEVEVAFNHTGSAGWHCFKVTATSAECSKDSRNREAAHCCKVNKTARWHIVFGVLSLFYSSDQPFAYVSYAENPQQCFFYCFSSRCFYNILGSGFDKNVNKAYRSFLVQNFIVSNNG